jgi:DNA-binding NarL/FixJ family response regulator
MLAYLEILLEPQFEVIASETEGDALVLTVEKSVPDLVILDFSLSFPEGLAAARQLQESSTGAKVVFFTSHEDSEYAVAAFEVGAMGYLVKQRTVDLGHYLGRVLRGERVCCPDHIQKKTAPRKKK